MRRRSSILVAVAAAAAVLVTGCSSGGSGSGSSASDTGSAAAATTTSSGVIGTITVLAAASLTESFTELGKSFEKANPGTTVTFSFGASSALAEQLTQGAPADVFASASAKNMTTVTDAKIADTPSTFAKNVMQIVVPTANPANVTSLQDLAKPEVKVVLCQPEVPCGATAQKVFTNAGITVTPVSQEADVKSTLTKVELNEADAAVVYVTDAKAAADKVKAIEIPADVNASTEYPIATVTKAPNAAGAKAFMAYVLSDEGQKVLTAAGFEKP